MTKQRVIVNFSRVKENDLAEIAKIIVNKMTGNAYFKTPTPPLATIQTAITEYSDALIKCKEGTKEQTAIKNVKKTTLDNYLTQLGNYINAIADGDLVKLDSTGFKISKVPEHIGILDAPKYVEIIYGNNPGEVIVNIDKVEKATDYLLLYMIAPASADNNEWFSKVFSKSTGTLYGLKSGTKYVFKATATSSEANKMDSYNFSSTIEKLIP